MSYPDGATDVEHCFQQAFDLHRQSRLDEAQRWYERTLQLEPRHFHALHSLGIVALQKNQPALAADLIAKALLIDPSSVAALVNYGAAQHELRRFEQALASYERAIELRPDFAETFFNKGNSLRECGKHGAAIESYDRAIGLAPTHADAYLNRGLAFSELEQPQAAIASYDKAIGLRPHHPDSHYNRGNELGRLGRYQEAIMSYEHALALQPGFAAAYLNRGSALAALRRYAGALASYDRAVDLQPRDAQAHSNRGGALQYLGRYAASVVSYDAALAIHADNSETHANRGRALAELKNFEAAIAAYDKAISYEPHSTALYATRRHLKMQICDWADLEADLQTIVAGVARGNAPPNPFYVLTLCDAPGVQQQAAAAWVAEHCPPQLSSAAFSERARSAKIHIGYFSADYHDHATSYLLAELLELHDRSRFKISAFSFGPASQGAMRKRIVSACDAFIDVRDRSDAEVVALARSAGIDIAVDLKGFTQDNRIGIFAGRAAPLQINFLGYPGTLGTTHFDFLIADRILIPAQSQRYYAEKIVYMPHSYQVNDTKRQISDKVFTRAELGLPSTGFVFCCFNNSYKLFPAVFDCWMRILARVEGSVLWLLGDNPVQIRNLRREAAQRSLAPERLVFAERTDLSRHLARHRAADLFLDTLPCNAHTTASDALWAGLPVLTCRGESFAARVAASLVTAIGLPELVAETPHQYEELAIHLATRVEILQGLRRRLSENRLAAPLFDAPRYCSDLENVFTGIYDQFAHGQPTRPTR